MLKLLRLMLAGGVIYGAITFPTWGGDLNMPEVVQAVQTGLQWMIKQVGKLK